MKPATHPTWNNTHHWPTCHKSQAAAGLPDGPLLERAPETHWPDLFFGVLIGALLIAPKLADLWMAMP